MSVAPAKKLAVILSLYSAANVGLTKTCLWKKFAKSEISSNLGG